MGFTRRHSYLSGWIVFLVSLLSIFVVGCTQSTSATDVSSLEPTVASALTPTFMPEPADVEASEADLVALGEEIFQRTAGGVGCQSCHGRDARGDIGPNIVGKSAEAIQTQLDTNEAMQFIILSPKDVEAVAAYLATLASQ